MGFLSRSSGSLFCPLLCMFFLPSFQNYKHLFCSMIHFRRSASSICILNFSLQAHLVGCLIAVFRCLVPPLHAGSFCSVHSRTDQNTLSPDSTQSVVYPTPDPASETAASPAQKPTSLWLSLETSVGTTNLQKCCLPRSYSVALGSSGTRSQPAPPPTLLQGPVIWI